MFFKFNFSAFLFSLMILSACGRGTSQADLGPKDRKPAAEMPAAGFSQTAAQQAAAQQTSQKAGGDAGDIHKSLDELAELERAGSWFQGMALTESTMRENAGDFAGAVAAAYKELSWAYGKGAIKKDDVNQGLLNLLAIKDNEAVTSCANAILAFTGENWAQASAGLAPLFDEFEEPDSFGRWMILVCILESASTFESASALESASAQERRAAAAYKSIRARYVQFPEYWYRGARAFSGLVAAEYAENCINSSPQGPFAGECRSIIADFIGLKSEDGVSIKTKAEIEFIITQSMNTGNPDLLEPLLPLISLPDNPYTIFAVGALRALNSNRRFRDYFIEQAAASKGRLTERLSYIGRG